MRPLRAKRSTLIASFIILLLLFMTGCAAAPSSRDMPPTINPSARYLLFLHGRIVKERGPHGEHPLYGPYDYYGLVQAFADRGFTVISEIRPRGTNPSRYADGVAR